MLSEDDELGAGGFADLIATAPPQGAQQGTLRQERGVDRYQRLISTARAAMAKHETQSKAEKGTKWKKGSAVEPLPKKARTLSAALGKAPPELGTETAPAIQVSTPGEASAAMALGASSLENYLIGADLLTQGTTPMVEQAQPLTSQTNITGLGMGGFLTELKGMLPKGGPKRAPNLTPVPQRPGSKWKPVLGKPTPSTATAASVLVPQQKVGGTGAEPITSTIQMETSVDMPGQPEGLSVEALTPVVPDICPTEPVDPDTSGTTQVAAEATEDIARGEVESA